MGRLTGRVAIVTGSGRGLGRSIAKCFASEGAAVAVVSLTKPNIDRTVNEINEAGGRAIGIVCDVCDSFQIQSAVNKVVAEFGAIDILVNNALEFSSVVGTINGITRDQVQRQMLGGPLAALTFMQSCYPYLVKSQAGRVINMGSSAGVMGAPGLGAYAMAKEAIRALSRSAAREWGPQKITVNCICPLAATDSYDQAMASGELTASVDNVLGRMGLPDDDIAPIALFLASDDAGYLTGYTLMADGGYMIDSAR